jgi:uncharacterized protein
MKLSRRDFLKFLGITTVAISSCDRDQLGNLVSPNTALKYSVTPKTIDDIVLPESYSYKIISSWKDPINDEEFFGTHNDYTAFFKTSSQKGLLWVNHESVDNKQIPGIAEQKKNVGGSVIGVQKRNSEWSFDRSNALNKRYDANTEFKITGPLRKKRKKIIGTLANSGGDKTPWDTVLSCEKNYQHFSSRFGWSNFAEEDFGWVVEIDPFNPKKPPVKHSSLGRFSHGDACVTQARAGNIVVYMGDDKEDEHLYKFISDANKSNLKSKLLEKGKLYVAKLDPELQVGRWLEISMDNETLKKSFKNEAELMINTRRAAKLLGATPLNRPQNIESSKYDRSIYVSMTGDIARGNPHGSIMKLKIKDHDDLQFSYERFLQGGEETGLSCPSSIAFDNKSNLWVCTDISGLNIGKGVYSYHGNNALFLVPTRGNHAGKPIRVASAPNGAQFTGPSFSDDYKTLFLSVQHPGQHSYSAWNKGLNGITRSAVIAIRLDNADFTRPLMMAV